MSASKRPAAEKSESKKSHGTSGDQQEKRAMLAERLQKIRDGSEILTAELDRLRQRLTAKT